MVLSLSSSWSAQSDVWATKVVNEEKWVVFLSLKEKPLEDKEESER